MGYTSPSSLSNSHDYKSYFTSSSICPLGRALASLGRMGVDIGVLSDSVDEAPLLWGPCTKRFTFFKHFCCIPFWQEPTCLCYQSHSGREGRQNSQMCGALECNRSIDLFVGFVLHFPSKRSQAAVMRRNNIAEWCAIKYLIRTKNSTEVFKQESHC